jgi:RNA polymerase sigma factor (sigma-70 family)
MTTAAAWIEACVARWERPLTQYAWRILGDDDDARDAVQDAFLRLCRQSRADVEDRLAEWLFTVVRNCAIDRLRKERPMQQLAEPGHAEPSAPPAAPSARLEQREANDGLLAALARLPRNQQECIRLKFQQGLSYQEISRVTALSVTNVGYLIHIGIRTLRERLVPDEAGAPILAEGARS